MPNVGFFDPELRGESWFDDEVIGFFDDEFIDSVMVDEDLWLQLPVPTDQTVVVVW